MIQSDTRCSVMKPECDDFVQSRLDSFQPTIWKTENNDCEDQYNEDESLMMLNRNMKIRWNYDC